MAVTRASGHTQWNPPTSPPFQIMKNPKAPPGAPTKARIGHRGEYSPSTPARARPGPAPRTPPAQIISKPFSPPGAPSAGRSVDRILHSFSNSLPGSVSTPSESDVIDILTIPPFSAPQVQMILWLSWTTTATPYQISHMHNRAFREASPIMSCWNVVDIENDVATNWHERGGSFTGMEPMSLLVPPRDSNQWSCLCDFGVENCWDYKRDQESAENSEKLAMAASLWDATPQQLLRCPHGRKEPRNIGRASAPVPERSLLGQRLEAVWARLVRSLPITLRGSHFAKLWLIVDSFYSISESGRQGWISDDTAQYLLYTWILGTIYLLPPWPRPFLAVSWYCIGWWALIFLNPAVPPAPGRREIGHDGSGIYRCHGTAQCQTWCSEGHPDIPLQCLGDFGRDDHAEYRLGSRLGTGLGSPGLWPLGAQGAGVGRSTGGFWSISEGNTSYLVVLGGSCGCERGAEEEYLEICRRKQIIIPLLPRS